MVKKYGLNSKEANLAKQNLNIAQQGLNVSNDNVKAQEKGEDKPVKQNDHALDALRYLLQTLYPNKKRGAYFVQ